MKIVIGVLVVILFLGLVIGGGLMSSRNDLVQEQEGIKGAWSQVDVVLQRRNDMIPNLVETVKGFASHEQAAIDSVTKARAAMMGAQSPADKIEADSQVRSALGRLFVITENYPNLKANENFLRLQDELAGDRESHCRGAAQVQYGGADLQHRHRDFPQEYRGVPVRLPPRRRVL